jgi:putative endopeptidase
MDTNRIESLRFGPVESDLEQVASLQGPDEAARLVGGLHRRGLNVCFGIGIGPDAKNSGIYALHLYQGGLGLPDRDYYLAENFSPQRAEYQKHIARMLALAGVDPTDAGSQAAAILELETELARASRTRTDLRDREKNYNRRTPAQLRELAPDISWDDYFAGARIKEPSYVIVGQPDFFVALNRLGKERDGAVWQAYLRWHLLRQAAPYLHAAAADENFRFYGKELQGQEVPEPRWQRAARVIDGTIGEALGKIFVEKYFPPAARARMKELVGNIRDVFSTRLEKLPWMSPATREEARRKFARFSSKIGHPDKFRDYSNVGIVRGYYYGKVQRANTAEFQRDADRIGLPVDRNEWSMTPQTVNAYFNPTQNEIVFPAGILQPPFFDITADDAVNYGAIGSIIGHEITHGYDDQGRKSDADGNLRDWWAAADAREFDQRAAKLVEQYNAYEPVAGAHVNGRLTLGENIADLGGVSIAYEALQHALDKNPEGRKLIDGFTPEQRFFLSFAQAWRVNTRETELRRRLVVDSHAPPQFRAFGPLVNLTEFTKAFDIRPGDPMWRDPGERAVIW